MPGALSVPESYGQLSCPPTSGRGSTFWLQGEINKRREENNRYRGDYLDPWAHFTILINRSVLQATKRKPMSNPANRMVTCMNVEMAATK